MIWVVNRGNTPKGSTPHKIEKQTHEDKFGRPRNYTRLRETRQKNDKLLTKLLAVKLRAQE